MAACSAHEGLRMGSTERAADRRREKSEAARKRAISGRAMFFTREVDCVVSCFKRILPIRAAAAGAEVTTSTRTTL